MLWERETWWYAVLGPDANGDGLGDVAVLASPEGEPDGARVLELLDGSSGALIKRLSPPASATFSALSYAGDIDGDGRADPVVVALTRGRHVLYVFGSER